MFIKSYDLHVGLCSHLSQIHIYLFAVYFNLTFYFQSPTVLCQTVQTHQTALLLVPIAILGNVNVIRQTSTMEQRVSIVRFVMKLEKELFALLRAMCYEGLIAFYIFC